MNKLLQLGTDAEYFVRQNGVVVSAIGCGLGSKDKPLLVDKGNLQEDNVLAEFAIDPVSTKEDWIANINYVTAQLGSHMNKHNRSLLRKSSHEFSKENLLGWGSKALELGCQPDTNAYTELDNERPNGLTRLRTAAAHVHFSYQNPTPSTTFTIIKALDYALGLWSVIEDGDKVRRNLYGQAGACRLKEYGGEYRVLGNFWLSSASTMSYVYDVTSFIVEHAEELLPRFEQIIGNSQLQAIINRYDVAAAELHYPLICRIMEDKRAELSTRNEC